MDPKPNNLDDLPPQEGGPQYTEEDFKREAEAWAKGQLDRKLKYLEKARVSGSASKELEEITLEEQKRTLDSWTGEYIAHHPGRTFSRIVQSDIGEAFGFIIANPEKFSPEILKDAKRFQEFRESLLKLLGGADFRGADGEYYIDLTIKIFISLRNLGYGHDELVSGYYRLSDISVAYKRQLKNG